MTVIRGARNSIGADVTEDNQLLVKAVSESELEFVSEEKGDAYSVSSTYGASANQEILYLKNTSSTKNLYIDYFLGGGSGATIFTVFKTTDTAGGTTVTPLNLNFSAGNSADASAYGNASVTGITAASATDIIFFEGISAASQFAPLDLKGAVILGQNDAIAVTTSAAVTVYCTLAFHFKDK